jgi:hypothetical protein
MRQKKKDKELISGKRFKLAMDVKNLQWKDLDGGLNATSTAMKKWPHRRIPSKWLFTVSRFFKVEEWVFVEGRLSDDDFKRIIYDPTLMDKFRQVKEAPSALPKIEEPLPDVDTVSPAVEKSLPESEASLPAIDTPLPKIKTSMPKVKTPSVQSLQKKGTDLKGEDPITAKRLRSAIGLKKIKIEILAAAFNTFVDAIKEWQIIGIPVELIPPMANFFNVEETVFTNKDLSQKSFRNIISKSTSQNANPLQNEAVKLLINAMNELESKGNIVNSSGTVIQAIQRRMPHFDFPIYGFKTFKDLCKLADKAKLIKIKDDGSQLNLKLRAKPESNPIATTTEKNGLSSKIDSLDLRKWFEGKLKVMLPDCTERYMIYKNLFTVNIDPIEGISLLKLSDKVGEKISSSNVAKGACYKIMYSLYRTRCFTFSNGTTPYNPIIHGLKVSKNDIKMIDKRFIENTIRVYLRGHRMHPKPKDWSELFFGSNTHTDLMNDITQDLSDVY